MHIKSTLSKFIRSFLPQGLYAKLRTFYYQMSGQSTASIDPVDNLEDWNVYLLDPRIDVRLRTMLTTFIENHESTMTSTYWSILCRKNVAQLLNSKYDNFKQTVAMNYFTWLVGYEDPQAVFLMNTLPKEAVINAKKMARVSAAHSFMTKEQSEFFNLMTFLLWNYTERTVGVDLLAQFEEPCEGNPPSVQLNKRNISQDLANSILEFHSISQGLLNIRNLKSIIELGGGYGRTAYVFLRMLPQVRYIMVDIPPALYIAERYLTGQFPDRRIFRYRSFHDFDDVADEFTESQIAFLMPDQLSLLPDSITDLFLAIDCLHEMRPEQIKSYFVTIDRLSEYFYQKCWKKTTIPYDNIVLTENDYPFLPNWQKIFLRDCRVQSTYFEALFRISRAGKTS
ncbi:putative sugar O-methyltransferase, partial [bacterium]|nr:putative sugar O-methyltransferase [candidate division CSSED10-310 bacterium]